MKNILRQWVILFALIGFQNISFAQTHRLPLNVGEIGSFHIGGRLVEISGKPIKEVVFSPGSAPAKIDPNGNYYMNNQQIWSPTSSSSTDTGLTTLPSSVNTSIDSSGTPPV